MKTWIRYLMCFGVGVAIGILFRPPHNVPTADAAEPARRLIESGALPSSVDNSEIAFSTGPPVNEKRPTLPSEGRKAADLAAILQYPEITEQIRFRPITDALDLNHQTLKVFGLESLAPDIQLALDNLKSALREYDDKHIERILGDDKSSVYLIPADKDSQIGAEFEESIRKIIGDPNVADFFIDKTREGLLPLTGDFAKTDRILQFKSLGPGDERLGYPEMLYSVEIGVLNPRFDTAALREQLAERSQNPADQSGDWILTNSTYRSAFATPPDYLEHVLE